MEKGENLSMFYYLVFDFFVLFSGTLPTNTHNIFKRICRSVYSNGYATPYSGEGGGGRFVKKRTV